MGVLWLFTGGRTAERVGDLVRGAGFDRIPDAAGNALDAARSTLRSGSESSSAAEFRRQRKRSGMPVRRVWTVSLAPDRKLPAPLTATPKTSRMPAERCSARRATICLNYSARSLWPWARSVLPSGPALPLRCRQRSLEAEYFGEASDNFKEQAADYASEQVSRATTVAEEVVTAVSDEARKQGLTVDAAKSAIADIPGKLGRVVDAAGKGISDRVNSTAP